MQNQYRIYFDSADTYIGANTDNPEDLVITADQDLHLEPDNATTIGDGGTTNYATFANDGELTLVGTARVVRELDIPVLSIALGASGVTTAEYGTYVVEEFGIGDEMHATIEIPPDWDSSTNLTIKLYWMIDEAYATNSGEVQWQIEWSACPADDSEALDAPTHTGTIDYGDQDIPATAKYLTETGDGTISVASLSEGDVIGFTISRIALDDGSNPTAEPGLVRMEIEYIANRLGEAN